MNSIYSGQNLFLKRCEFDQNQKLELLEKELNQNYSS
jgi:hypothetical protein